jgi:hypothetical protein
MYENPTTEVLAGMKSVAYAHFSALGTWVSQREPCEACKWHWQRLGPPLLVKWQPSTEVIGDFSWDGPLGYTFVVKENVAKSLRAMRFECDFLPVEYVEPELLGKSKCVPFPYEGVKLLWTSCKSFVDLDMHASEVTITKSCSVCGDVRYTFRYDGIIVRARELHSQMMFRIRSNGNSDATFVTEEGRQMMQREGFTNIAFSEAGRVV